MEGHGLCDYAWFTEEHEAQGRADSWGTLGGMGPVKGRPWVGPAEISDPKALHLCGGRMGPGGGLSASRR